LPTHRPIVINESLIASLNADEARIMNDLVIVQSPPILNALRDLMKMTLPSDTTFLSQLQGSPDVDQASKTIEAPALILCGRQDSLCGYRDAWQLLEKYPRATFAVLDRAGHALGDEQPRVTSMLIEEWIDRVEEYVRMNPGA
jgi:pimeloyl-ACP methyl ester carboxylesterase